MQARDTVTAVELDAGETCNFTLLNGETRRITLVSTRARIITSNLETPMQEQFGGKTVYRIHAEIMIDDTPIQLVREIGSQKSFVAPYNIMGLWFWFDAIADPFDTIVTETHGACRPRKQIRFAIQDATQRICPPLLHPWCPLPSDGLRIEDCYAGDDCWMGAYQGGSAHGGLDINHPAGTPLWTPFAVDDQQYFNSVAAGDNNNRWRGIKRWADGSQWEIQACHLIRLLVEENTQLDAGHFYAESAGMHVGAHEHTHFKFGVNEPSSNETIWLDPWILFYQMYQDRAVTSFARGTY